MPNLLLPGTHSAHTLQETHKSVQDKSKIPEQIKLLPVSEIVNRLKVSTKPAAAEPAKKTQKQQEGQTASQPAEKKGKQEAKPQQQQAAAATGGAYDDFSKCQLQVRI